MTLRYLLKPSTVGQIGSGDGHGRFDRDRTPRVRPWRTGRCADSGGVPAQFCLGRTSPLRLPARPDSRTLCGQDSDVESVTR